MAQKPYNYDFCQIPNTAEGKEFIRLLKLFRNKDKYCSIKNHDWG